MKSLLAQFEQNMAHPYCYKSNMVSASVNTVQIHVIRLIQQQT